jgi:hypothetical protein
MLWARFYVGLWVVGELGWGLLLLVLHDDEPPCRALGGYASRANAWHREV